MGHRWAGALTPLASMESQTTYNVPVAAEEYVQSGACERVNL